MRQILLQLVTFLHVVRAMKSPNAYASRCNRLSIGFGTIIFDTALIVLILCALLPAFNKQQNKIDSQRAKQELAPLLLYSLVAVYDCLH